MSKKPEKNQRIQVFARCRPLNSNERKQCSPSIVEVLPDKKIVVKDRTANREFLFDKVFPPDTKQISIYKAVVGPLIQEVLMGYNCTVFAYGQTGTGKTYTMEGERNNTKCSWEDDPGAGIIPRSLHQLFEDLNKEENVEFSVRVSFLELYNEELFDLLSSTELSKLRLFEDSSKKGSVIIQGLEEILVNSKDEVYTILEKGTARRQTAATMLNASSSRSHTVFSVTVHIKENTIEGEELLKTGKLNLVDLAGSENVARSGAVDKRAREAGNINQSLLTLGRVITALIEKTPHVPYRESKLTRLLQDSLGGHTKTSIIATVSPAHCNFEETISTLDYATKAKSITINPEVNQKMTKRALIREYTEEIERLRKDLVALRSKDGFYIDLDNYTNLLHEIEEKKYMIKDLSDKIELLTEENTKIEEMFNITKNELSVTSEKLNQTTQKYKDTADALSNTMTALNCTKQVLTETALERDEKQFLINIQSTTEKKLSQQAQKLLYVADETTNVNEKLHSKIERISNVEKANEETLQEFKMRFQKQLESLTVLITHSVQQQTVNLSSAKEDFDNLMKIVMRTKEENNNFVHKFVSQINSDMGNLWTNIAAEADSQINWSNSFLDEFNQKKDLFLYKQNSFLSEKLSEFMQQITAGNLEMKNFISDVHDSIVQKKESMKLNLFEIHGQLKQFHNSINTSLDSLCKSYEETSKNFGLQISAISTEEEIFLKDFQDLMKRRTEINKKYLQRDSTLLSQLETNKLKIEELHKPLASLSAAEDMLEEKIVSDLNEMSSLLDMQKFSKCHDNICQVPQKFTEDIEKNVKEHKEVQEIGFSETESSLKGHIKSISHHLQTLDKSFLITESSIKESVNSSKTSLNAQLDNIEKNSYKIKDTIKEDKTLLHSDSRKIKDEILKVGHEFEKFVSEDFHRDVPTGATPHRKSYSYPRLLAATSPHERLLHRYRSQLATDTAISVNLPLNSSFNESDELKDRESSEIEKSKEVANVLNTSFSSDDSAACDTDSCISMSDVSIDGRNKENKKRSKKASRLPKMLPSKMNFFAKPGPVSPRKPLVSSNSAVTENNQHLDF